MCKCSLSVRSPAGELRIIKLNPSKKQQKTVKDLKMKAAQLFPKKGYLQGEFQLVVAGKPLDGDSAPLSEYGIKPSPEVQTVAKVHGVEPNLPVFSKSTEDLTVRRFKNEVEGRTFPGYTKNDSRLHTGAKLLDGNSAPLGECRLSCYYNSTVQMTTNLKGPQLFLLNQVVGQIFIITPEGKMYSMWLYTIQLQVMTVDSFTEEVLKIFVIQGYTKENVRLHVDGIPLGNPFALLANYRIKASSIVQMVMKVNGG